MKHVVRSVRLLLTDQVIIKFISALVLFVRYEIFNKCPLLCYAL